MTVIDGDFVEDSREAILEAMVADAKEYWGEDLSDGQESFVRAMYIPVAGRFAEAQNDIGLVLESAQIDNAEDKALGLLTALIGVVRIPAAKATGEAVFSREVASTTTDYTIPKGTIVQTEGNTPVRFETTQSGVLEMNTTSVTIPIKAVKGGVKGNVAANHVTVMPSPPSGVEAVTNPAATENGRNEETDPALRARAKKQLSAGSRASANALLSAVGRLDGVKSTSIFLNKTNDPDADGQAAHSFELVVEGGNDTEIAQTIFETKAAGDTSESGIHGTAVGPFTVELVNGQTEQLGYSVPVLVQVYIDADIQTTSEYEGDNAVLNSIVQYIGGLLSTGGTADGQLGVGDDVIIGEIEYAIRSVAGVHDVTSLTAALDIAPTSTDTSNIAVGDGSVATSDATDATITLTTTQV